MNTGTPELSFSHNQRTYYLDPTTLEPGVDYECPICKVFMIEPYKLCSGEDPNTGRSWNHRICRRCLDQLPELTCPLCRCEIDKAVVTRDFAILTDLKVYCPNQDCTTTLSVSPIMAEAHHHLAEECAKEMIECPAQCGVAKMTRESLGAHEQVCPRRYICECGQIFSGTISCQEIDLHANETPEKHLLTRVARYCRLSQTPPSTRGAQQWPVPVIAHVPESRVWADVECISITKDIYQSKANPRTLFIPIPIHASGRLHQFIPYRDYENGSLEQLRFTLNVKGPVCGDCQVTIDICTHSRISPLQGATVTVYTGTPAQPYRVFTVRPSRGYHDSPQENSPLFFCGDLGCRPDNQGNFLFKIEI